MPELVRFTSIVPLTAAAPDDPAPSSRTIEGLLVEYGVPRVAGDGITYTFRPGSLQASSRGVTPALLGHDVQRPAGVLRELRQANAGPTAVIAVDQTPDGDLALAQAASGSRAGLSVGAEPITYTLAENGDVDVELAELHELSLVTIPAWEAATVSRVTAQSGGAMPPVPAAVHDPEPDPAPPPPPEAQPAPPAPELVLAHRAPLVVTAADTAPRLTLDAFVSALVRAERGDPEARRLIQAAAPVPSFLADNPGVLPPTYTAELLGELPSSRPLVGICAQRAMPASGMLIRKPIWTAKPAGGWVADDTVGAPTNTPKIGLHDVNVEQWQYAFATSQAVAERSSPDYIEAVYRQAIVDYHNDCEAKLAAAIVAEAAAADVSIGAGIAAVYTATGRVANVLLLAPDAYGALIDADGTHRFSSGQVGVSANGLVGNIYGLDVVVSGSLPATTAVVGVRNAIEFRETNPIRLSANVIGAMTIELGVLSFATFDVEVPDAFVAVGMPVPPVALSSSRSSK